MGVNLGQTMLKVAACDPNRIYLGFEPNPACADYAGELIRANGWPYTVVPAGLGPKAKVLFLHLYRQDQTDPSATLVENFRRNEVGSKPAVVISMDDLPYSLLPTAISIIKIDVEGGELEVVQALQSCLTQHRPFVIMEILPSYHERNLQRISRQKKIERDFAQRDYVVFRVHKVGAEGSVDLALIPEIGIHGDESLSDYLFSPREYLDVILEAFSRRTV